MAHRIGRTLSYLLRHAPDEFGVELSPDGWARIPDVISGLQTRGLSVDATVLTQEVDEDSKGRFEISEDNSRVRALYGHSVEVDPDLTARTPPDILYHGTPISSVEDILKQGLRPMSRQVVHLSADTATARQVGSRRGEKVALLIIDARVLSDKGQLFYNPTVGIWVTGTVPPEAIQVVRR